MGLRMTKSPAPWMLSQSMLWTSPSVFSTLSDMPVLPTMKPTSLTVPTMFPSLLMTFMPMSLSLVTFFSFAGLDKN